ncbi:MAG: hypothetical protein Q4C67_10450 [Deinococcus sp.]|nr:hypothetical protein [Deinococcus sp.]
MDSRLPRSRRLSRWVRAYQPNDPPFSRWHLAGLLIALVLGVALLYAPGLLADVGRLPLGDSLAAIYARLTALFLIVVALFVARSMHPLTALVLWLGLISVGFRLGEVRMTGEPLTLAFTAAVLAFSLTAIRVIVRPNETDIIAEQQRRIGQLEGQLRTHGITPSKEHTHDHDHP